MHRLLFALALLLPISANAEFLQYTQPAVGTAQLPTTSVQDPREQMILGNATIGLPKWLTMDLGDNYLVAPLSGATTPPGTHSLFLGPGAGAHMSGTGRYYNHGFGWYALSSLIDSPTSFENTAFGQCAGCLLVDGGFNTFLGNANGLAVIHGTGNVTYGIDNMRGTLLAATTISGVDGSYNTSGGFNTLRGSDGNVPYLANAVTAANWSGGLATLTTTIAHGVTSGQRISLSGFTPAAWNGYWAATTGSTGTTLVLTMATDPTAASVLGQLDAGGGPVDFEFETAFGKSAGGCDPCSGLSTNNVWLGAGVAAAGKVGTGETRQRNVAIGLNAGFNLSGNAMSAVLVGALSGFSNTVGGNVGLGDSTCYGIIADNTNVCIGTSALAYLNQTGTISFSTVGGWHAMAGSPQSGTITRMAVWGSQAGLHIAAGAFADTLSGFNSGLAMTTGTLNSLYGDSSGTLVTSGTRVTGFGASTLSGCTTCSYVAAIGPSAAPTLVTGQDDIIISTGFVTTDVPAAATTHYINFGNTWYADMLKMHESTGTGVVPVLTACGTSLAQPGAGTANDDIGTITEGTNATGCTILWHAAYANTSRVCVVSSPNIPTVVSYDDTQLDRLVVTHAATGVGVSGILKYMCKGIGPNV